MSNNIRNVAIIAHVDHGKTTLVDALLRGTKTDLGKKDNTVCIMDSNDLERERGITIFSKNASVRWNDLKINIIDTPGHADFGGEVERVLELADGCLLLVDAKEGPMPQTRFVLKKALAFKMPIVVVINKLDKPEARPKWVIDKVFDLFMELGAADHLADFPVVYASAKNGLAGWEADLSKMTGILPIFEAIEKYVPSPSGDPEAPLQFHVTSIGYDNFKGRIATGRVVNGRIKAGQEIMHIRRDGSMAKARLTALMGFEGLERVDLPVAEAGDIIAVSGLPEVTIGETLADVANPIALPLLHIEEPTVKMTFCINDSPFAGKEGGYTTSRQIRARLYKELETDMALRVEDTDDGRWVVSGRGELHLAIVIERMRRDDFEFQVSRPQVIPHEVDGKTLFPHENIFVEVPEEFSGVVIQKLSTRHAEMKNMEIVEKICFLEFIIPTRGLFGYRNEFLTDTKGLGIMNTSFYGYQEDAQNWKEREQGSLVATENAQTLLYGLLNVQDQGRLFFGPGVQVYKGEVVGQNCRPGDLFVNVCKEKQLSNMRSRGSGVADHFDQPRTMGLEDALEYIGDDELVEITPKSVRIRKKILDEAEARRVARGIKS